MIASNQKGIGIGYVLGVVGLLAILGAIMAQNTGIRETAIEKHQRADQLVAQGNILRNALVLCAIAYPKGGSEGGYNNTFPATTNAIGNAICPGQGTQRVFGGVSSISYPKKIEGIHPWQLVNDSAGVRLLARVESTSDLVTVDAMAWAASTLGEGVTTYASGTLTYHITQ